MKKIILLSTFLIFGLVHGQKQYVNVSTDIRNGILGSKPTNNNPELDIVFIGGVTDRNNITIEIGYERFKAIGFERMYAGLGYTFIHWSKKLECNVMIEPTIIIRDWKDRPNDGKPIYNAIGASSRVTYNFTDQFGLSLLGNLLLREDNAEKYEISTPKIYSFYLGLTYTFKRNNN